MRKMAETAEEVGGHSMALHAVEVGQKPGEPYAARKHRHTRKRGKSLRELRARRKARKLENRSAILRTRAYLAAETGPGRRPFSGTPPSSTENAPTDSLLSVMRLLGVGSLRLKIVAFTLLSLIGGLSQAVLLVLISEVAVAEVEGKHSIRALGRSFSPTSAILVSLLALVLFLSTGIFGALLSTSVSEQALTVTRTRVVVGFFRSNWSLQSTERLGHIQQLLTMNSQATGQAVQNLSIGLQSLMMVSGLLGVALTVDPAAAIGVIAVGIVLSLILRPLNLRSRRANRALSTTTRAMATQVTEYTRLSRDFRLFGVETHVMDTLRRLIEDTGHVYRRTQMLSQMVPILYQSFALGFIIIAIVFLAGAGHARFAELGAILLLVLRSVSYGSNLQSSIQGLRSSQGLLEDVTRELGRFEDARMTPGDRVPESFEVDFDSVEYSYDGVTLALSGINMHIPEGKIVGVLGPSGSGKTTISQLLLGLREPTGGRATIGGEDAAAISKSDAQCTVALVPQEPVLLQGSVIDNIRFFRNFEEREVIDAARSAYLHEDVVQMPAGYETPVGEGGGALSGGQKQRLAIARALIGSPKLMVLDEPTSAVDGRTEQLIRQTLSELRGHVTVVIISHRIETTAQCDLLLVLANGKIADYGERDAVLAGPAYRDIVLSRHQFSGDDTSGG
jgi:ATP-binding cassette, subfamily B, bacterial